MANQNPEQIARDKIDEMLTAAGWIVQDHQMPDLNAGLGIALREYPTSTGPTDYLLVVDKQPCGLIEAKKFALGYNLTDVEQQSEDYADAELKHYGKKFFIRFIYESTGIVTHFRDRKDPKPRSREVFSFMRPEEMQTLLAESKTLRGRLKDEIPPLTQGNLRDCQFSAIKNLEQSFADARTRALVQMATGAGKTFTAITSVYRLLKYARAKRILMLVDTKQLGIQALEEFQNYQPVGEQYKFPELYHVQRLTSSEINSNARVCISTIQRMYSILKGQELDEESEEDSIKWQTGKNVAVEYNPTLPPEFFDFIIIDECHRSIYNLWRQVLEYFDAFLTGLTATPDNRTFAFFKQNVVSEYTHEQAILDGVNVGGDVYLIDTKITQNGETISCEQQVRTRDKLTRAEKWANLDDDLPYQGKDLDKKVVNKSQIRTIIREFKKVLFTKLFPHRSGECVPKTLIFAKDDSHANDIVEIVREVFGEGNDFCKKVTYQAKEDPKSILSQFRNGYYPRIAVTVDMIATGTDVKPLECLLFMRDVRSANYFEQMKGRGTRTIDVEALMKVTPDAKDGKLHYVLVDAVGVTKSMKTISGSFEKNPGVSLKDLLEKAALSQLTADEASSLAGRLIKLEKVLTDEEKSEIQGLTGGGNLKDIATALYNAFDPDNVKDAVKAIKDADSSLSDDEAKSKAELKLQKSATAPFNGTLNHFLLDAKKTHEQFLDDKNIDVVTRSAWAIDDEKACKAYVEDFENYLYSHRDEIEPLQIYFEQPQRRKEVTLAMITDFLKKMATEDGRFSVEMAWGSYYRLGRTEKPRFDGKPEAAMLSLIRYVAGIDKKIVPFSATVDANYKTWVFKWNNAHPDRKLTDEEAEFMRHVRDHYKVNLHIYKEDFDLIPFTEYGGYFRFKKIFGSDAKNVIDELNEALAA